MIPQKKFFCGIDLNKSFIEHKEEMERWVNKMEIIVGTVILKDDKILMVKEAKKECYGKWAFPAGHLEKNETVFAGALRETKEETGYDVKLNRVFPIIVRNDNSMNIIMFHFLGNIVEETQSYNYDEILETKWIKIEELKKMKEEEFRSPAVVKKIIESIEKNELYNLEIFKDIPNL